MFRPISRNAPFCTSRIWRNLYVSLTARPFSNQESRPLQPMTWTEFFTFRRRFQLYRRLGGVPSVIGFWLAEGALLSLPIFDPTRTFYDVDPMVLVGMLTVLGSFGSYFLGASMTGTLWRIFKSDTARSFEQKQKDFYQRITKYRANVPPNPTQMTFSADFYGEKIRSISDYRKWLRNQKKAKADRIFTL